MSAFILSRLERPKKKDRENEKICYMCSSHGVSTTPHAFFDQTSRGLRYSRHNNPRVRMNAEMPQLERYILQCFNLTPLRPCKTQPTWYSGARMV